MLIGETSFGTPVYINREVASCDLRVAIGGVIPYYSKHIYNGGGKIVLPGISGIETIGDLTTKTEAELAAIPNFGRKSVEEVRETLGAHGLTLRGEELVG